jgi:hypothetical protein
MKDEKNGDRLKNLSRAALLKEKMFLEGLLFARPADAKIRAKHDEILEEIKRRRLFSL